MIQKCQESLVTCQKWNISEHLTNLRFERDWRNVDESQRFRRFLSMLRNFLNLAKTFLVIIHRLYGKFLTYFSNDFSSILLRLGLSLVFLWFGFSQLFNPDNFIGYVPQFAYALPMSSLTIVFLNGLYEVVFGTLLLLGFFTRVSALLLALKLFVIILSNGYNDISVRDFGLALATLSVYFHGHDSLSLDNKTKK